MSVVLLDPNLQFNNGHHFNWDQAIATAFIDRKVTIYSNVRYHSDSQQNFNIVPLFTTTIYKSYSSDKYIFEYENCRIGNEIIENELNEVKREQFGLDDIVIVPTCNEQHALGYVKWMKRFDVFRSPRFFIFLMFSSGLHPSQDNEFAVDKPYSVLFYRKAFERALSPGPPIHFLATSLSDVDAFSALASFEIRQLPIPLNFDRSRIKKSTQRRAIVYAGDAKITKGVKLLPALVGELCCSFKDWVFVAHVNYNNASDSTQTTREDLQAISSRLPNFELHEGWLDPENYTKLLESGDCIILTYDSQVYRHKSSGLLWEAVGLGIPAVLPRGSWLEAEARRYDTGYDCYDQAVVGDIAGGFARIVSDFEAQSERAQVAARRFNSLNGATAFREALADVSGEGV